MDAHTLSPVGSGVVIFSLNILKSDLKNEAVFPQPHFNFYLPAPLPLLGEGLGVRVYGKGQVADAVKAAGGDTVPLFVPELALSHR